MSLQDLIIPNEKCEEYEQEIIKLKSLLKQAKPWVKSRVLEMEQDWVCDKEEQWLKTLEEMGIK